MSFIVELLLTDTVSTIVTLLGIATLIAIGATIVRLMFWA